MRRWFQREIVVEAARHADDALEATLRIGRKRAHVVLRCRDLEPIVTDDPFVPIAALLGLQTGRRVRMEGPVSAPLLESLDLVRTDLAAWYPDLRPLRLVAHDVVPAPGPRGGGAAAFFSAGLDSFYTALAHAEDTTHLIFVHGFDVRLDDTALRRTVAERVRAAAAGLACSLVEVETDLRRLSDRYADWSWYSHAGLIAVALLLSPHFREVRIAGTLADVHRPAPLRGSGDTETWYGGLARIRGDGAEATRPEKARFIAGHPAARAHLRVCWENRDGAYNCGRCPKCLRTLINLEVAGVRDRFDTFPGSLDLDAVRRLPVEHRSDRQMLEESLWMAEAEDRRPDIAEALRTLLATTRLLHADRVRERLAR